MKKKLLLLSVLSVIVIAGLGLLLSGCPNTNNANQNESGKVILTLVNNTSRMLNPNISMTIATYDIYASDTRGNHVEIMNFPQQTVVLDALAYGEWTFRINGKNADGIVIGTATQTVQVNTGEAVPLNMIIIPLTGTGTLNLTVNWNQSDTYEPGIDSQLVASDGTIIPLAFTITGGNQGTYSGSFAAGYYALRIRLLDNDLLAYGIADIARIAEGGTTTGVYDFTNINLPGGTVNVQVTPQMNDPIDVTISGAFSEMDPGDTEVVSASIPSSVGAANFVWYLNGEPKDVGGSFTVSGLSSGIYNLSVIAISVDGLRAGQADFIFTVTGQPGGPGLRLMRGATVISYNTSFDFDTIPAALRDTSITFSIINGGTASLALTGSPIVAISGANADAFTIDTTGTLTNIPPKQSTTFTIRMTSTEAMKKSLNARISIANTIQSVNPFTFAIHCTDKSSGSFVFTNVSPGEYSGFGGNFTGLATVTISGGGGGGGGGASYSAGNPPYTPPSVSSGSRGGNGGDATLAAVNNVQMQHGISYKVNIGAGGNGGNGGAVNANGGSGGSGQASTFIGGSTILASASGGLGGGGGLTGSATPGTDRPAASGADGGAGGAGGSGYVTTDTTGTPPYQTTTTTYHRNPGSAGAGGLTGYATITWVGFELP